MKKALLSKNNFKFVNGDLPESTHDDKVYEAWLYRELHKHRVHKISQNYGK